LTHKGIVGIIFIAGVIGMGVYSLNDLIEQGNEKRNPQHEVIDETTITDDVNTTTGINHHIIIDDGVRGTAT